MARYLANGVDQLVNVEADHVGDIQANSTTSIDASRTPWAAMTD